jgi:hypothetical protein
LGNGTVLMVNCSLISVISYNLSNITCGNHQSLLVHVKCVFNLL